jgi:hypothetical protein
MALAAACGRGEPAVAPPPVLPSSALPRLHSTLRTFNADRLAATDGIAGLRDDLRRWRFQAAAERTFQGPSKTIQIVQARAVQFAAAAGAAGYLSTLHRHAGNVFGTARSRPLRVGRRGGWLVVPQACACHEAQPTVAAILRDGRRVLLLQVTGPTADRRALLALVRRAP